MSLHALLMTIYLAIIMMCIGMIAVIQEKRRKQNAVQILMAAGHVMTQIQEEDMLLIGDAQADHVLPQEVIKIQIA